MEVFGYLVIGFMAGCVFAIVLNFIEFYIHKKRK